MDPFAGFVEAGASDRSQHHRSLVAVEPFVGLRRRSLDSYQWAVDGELVFVVDRAAAWATEDGQLRWSIDSSEVVLDRLAEYSSG